MADYQWRCLECGYTFASAAEAEEAYMEEGCPQCGGSDYDESLPIVDIRFAEEATQEMVNGGRHHA